MSLKNMPIAKRIAQQLTSNKQTLATAESCSGGLVAHTLTNIPGSSVWFKAGVIAYAYEAKTDLLGVPKNMLQKHGAVSAPVVKAMVQGIRKRFKTDFGISITGIAGPTGGTKTKPVGLVFIAVASNKKTVIRYFIFKGTRLQIKKQATETALKMLLTLL
ncbi:MAG: CinA family protein [Candidatus Omnitrophica bacterium]|nr:CinA family protein [Candidatus Omnitrophota bacterium]